MKNLKKLIIGGTLILTMSTTVLAGEVPSADKQQNTIECIGEACYNYGYNQLTKEQEEELKQLEVKIDELYTKLDPLYSQVDDMVKDLNEIDIFANFDNFRTVMIINIATEEQVSQAKVLFEDIRLEEDSEEGDFESAYHAWIQLEEMDILKENITYSVAYDISQLSEAEQKLLAELDAKIIDLEKQLEAIYNEIDETYGDDFYFNEDFDDEDFVGEYTFEDFKADNLKEDTTKEQVTEAEELFDQALKLEEDDKWEEAAKVWDELFEKDYIMEYDFELEPYSFEDFKEELKDDVTQEDLNKAKELFMQAMQLEEEEKYDDAWELWDQLWSMDIYDFDYEDCQYED